MIKDKDKFLTLAKERFKVAQEASDEIRAESTIDHQFENGQQWDPAVEKEREGRPCLTNNKISGVVKQIIGDQRQNSPSIKVMPVDSDEDPETAEIYTGIIRNIEQFSDADAAYDTGFFHQVVGGYGAWRVNTQYAGEDSFEQDIVVDRIRNPHSVYFDPFAQKIDKSDAKYCFIIDDMSRKEFEAQYPDVAMSDFDGEDSETEWIREETVRVAEYFWKEPYSKKIYQLADGKVVDNIEDMIIEVDGVRYVGDMEIKNERTANCERVRWAKMTAFDVIDERDWPGKYIPVVFVPGEETFVDGKTVLRSAIRFARDPQRIYNWMSSASVETIAQAPKMPWVLTANQIEGFEQDWQEAGNRPKPYLLYNPDHQAPPPQRLGGSTPDIGALQEAQKAADDIKATTGVFDASLGARGNETSGKAIIARQREGDTATYTFIDNLSRAIKYTGKILVDLIPKIYDTQRIVRTLGEDGAEKFVEVNKVVNDPSSPDGYMVLNDLTVGKYDVVVNVGPSYQTQRVESAEAMLGFVQAVPQAGQFILDLIAKNMDWPGAQEIEERLKKLLPHGMNEKNEDLSPEEQQQRMVAQQKQQQVEQLQNQLAMLELETKKIDLQKRAAEIMGMKFDQQGQQLDNKETMVDIQTKLRDLAMGVI